MESLNRIRLASEVLGLLHWYCSIRLLLLWYDLRLCNMAYSRMMSCLYQSCIQSLSCVTVMVLRLGLMGGNMLYFASRGQKQSIFHASIFLMVFPIRFGAQGVENGSASADTEAWREGLLLPRSTIWGLLCDCLSAPVLLMTAGLIGYVLLLWLWKWNWTGMTSPLHSLRCSFLKDPYGNCETWSRLRRTPSYTI